MSRRDPGMGSIERTADGRFRPRLPRALGRRYLETCDTEPEAKAALAAELLAAAKAPPDRLTLGAWGETWLEERAASGLYRSTDRELRRWRKHVADSPLGRTPLEDVSAADVRAWLHALEGAPSTRRNALTLVRGACRAALEQHRTRRDPAAGVSLPRSARRPPAWTWLRLEEIERLLEVAADWQRPVFTTAIYTGLRAGELWALRWDDLDLEAGVLHVRHAVTEDRKLGPPKSGRAREVPLLAPVVAALRDWPRDGELVFPGRYGEPHPRGHRADLYAALRSARITRRVRFHDLRHTCASHLIQGSWAPGIVARPLRLEEVQAWLGHSSRSVTERYAHLAPDGLRGLRVAYEGALATGFRGDPKGTRSRGLRADSGSESAIPSAVGQRVGQLVDETLAALARAWTGDPTAAREAVAKLVEIRAESDRLVEPTAEETA